MKRNTLLITVLLLAIALHATDDIETVKKDRNPILTIWAMGEVLLPQDSRYTDLFGDSQINPKAQINLHLSSSISLFAGFSFAKRQGRYEILDLSIETESSQTHFSFGAGYTFHLSEKLNWFVEAGAFLASFEESAMEKAISGSAFGFILEAGMTLKIAKSIMTRLHIGYSQAQKEVEGYTAKPGGIAAGVGLGFRF